MTDTPHTILGIDFGTTNSVIARADAGQSHLVPLKGPRGADPVFRSALCFWEDDGQDDRDADEVCGGPNGTLSLTEARASFRNLGACETRFLNKVRRPLPDEQE